MSLPPQLLKPCRICGVVADGMLNVAMPQIVLNEPDIRTLIGESNTAGMAQRVGMYGNGKAGLLSIFAQGQVDG